MLYTFTPFSVPIFMTDACWKDRQVVHEIISETETENKKFGQRLNLEQDIRFDSLKELILSIVPSLTERLGLNTPDCEISSMWLNTFKENEFIHPHWHVNSWLSGVYYPYGCETSPISFESPLPCPTLSPAIKNKTQFNQEIAEYRIKTESFLFFPSWLRHYTVPTGPEEKISIAFNIWPRGLLQSDAISKVVV
jgi:uncharacterized protein (TIGR02466 family)